MGTSERELDAALPWSSEAEQAVLGALLLDHERAMLALADHPLGAADFFDDRHRAIWTAIAGMQAGRRPVDVITAFEALREAGQAEWVGGMAYLNALAASVPSAGGSGRYAAIVRDKAVRRALIDAADRARELAWAQGDAAASVDAAQALFVGLGAAKASAGPRLIAELVAERMDHWQALADGTVPAGIPTGLAALDAALDGGLRPGRVLVLAARPSVGKTSLAAQIALHVAGQGHSVLMLSQEMPASDLVDRAVAHLGRVRLGAVATGRFTDDDMARLGEACDVAGRLLFFVDDTPALTLMAIRSKAWQVRQRHGLALVVVDYMQLLAGSGRRDTRHHEIEEISRGTKTLAKELGITVLMLSQVNRAAADREPELHDLKESGACEEDADAVALLHPMGNEPDGRQVVLLKIAKNRAGRRGRIALAFDGSTQRWEASGASVARRRGGVDE